MKLTIETLSKQYRHNLWGLRDFDLELRPGVIGLLGPNGAGKSIRKPPARIQVWFFRAEAERGRSSSQI